MIIAIVAQGGSSRSYFKDAEFLCGRHVVADEVWAINSMGGVIQHDLLFHMDDCKLQESRVEKRPRIGNMIKWLKEHPKFFTSKVYPDYPGAMAYPLQEVMDYIGPVAYFNSTVAYALAYAMMQEPKEIKLYGIDFTNMLHEKAERGRACVEMYCGLAMKAGINITVPPTTSLFDANLGNEYRFYGYDAYTVKRDLKNQVTLEPAELPSAEEIEKRYEPDYPPTLRLAI